MTTARISAGIPTGGQFAPTGRTESEISFTLDDASDDLLTATDAERVAGQTPLTAEQHAALDAAEEQAQRDADAVTREFEEAAQYGTDTGKMPMLALNDHPWVRAALAKNPAVPDHLMHRLTDDPAPVVRLAVAEHSKDIYDLNQLREDPDPRVRQQAIKTHAKVARKAALDKAKYGETTVALGSRSPWGTIDDIVKVAPGIASVGTPSHGGFKLTAQRNRQVNPAWRKAGGWYEEDCDSAIVMVSFPDAFPAEYQAAATASAKNNFPDQYEEVTGTKLAPGESGGRDRQLFTAAHINDQVVVSASTSDDHPGMVEVTSQPGGFGATGPQQRKRFLVPTAEYRARGPYGFVIDPVRHEELT